MFSIYGMLLTFNHLLQCFAYFKMLYKAWKTWFDFQNGNGKNGDVIDGVGGGGSLNGTMRTAPRTPSAHHKNGGTTYHSNPVWINIV